MARLRLLAPGSASVGERSVLHAARCIAVALTSSGDCPNLGPFAPPPIILTRLTPAASAAQTRLTPPRQSPPPSCP
jgi:hypothetical protein